MAAKAGAVVVDNSSAFRMDPNVPLVIPEINPQAMCVHQGIIANPNCSTIIGITPLWPIHRVNRIRRLIAATYQAASGAGAAAMEELTESTRAYLENQPYQNTVLPHPYAFNLFSHNTKIDPETGYNEEETKMAQETAEDFRRLRKFASARHACACRCCALIPRRSRSSASGPSLRRK